MAGSPVPSLWFSPAEIWMWDYAAAQRVVEGLLVAGAVLALIGLGLLGWLVVAVLAPQVPWRPIATLVGLAGTLAVVGLLLRRPWLVEAERQGLDPPRRVWRVVGWRRSGRCVREVAAAVAQGRLDIQPAGAVLEQAVQEGERQDRPDA